MAEILIVNFFGSFSVVDLINSKSLQWPILLKFSCWRVPGFLNGIPGFQNWVPGFPNGVTCFPNGVPGFLEGDNFLSCYIEHNGKDPLFSAP